MFTQHTTDEKISKRRKSNRIITRSKRIFSSARLAFSFISFSRIQPTFRTCICSDGRFVLFVVFRLFSHRALSNRCTRAFVLPSDILCLRFFSLSAGNFIRKWWCFEAVIKSLCLVCGVLSRVWFREFFRSRLHFVQWRRKGWLRSWRLLKISRGICAFRRVLIKRSMLE